MKKKILFTGSYGFLGRNTLPILKNDFHLISLDLENADIKCNLSSSIPVLPTVDIVIHAASKAHLTPNSKTENKLFNIINYQGTVNLLTGLKKKPPQSFIYISSVSVYGIQAGTNITEEFSLLGKTPYALSKIRAEEYLVQWCKENKVKLGILRPSLIAGKNPPGNLGAMINGIKTGKYFRIGKGSVRKSLLMADDIARIIPRLATVGGIYNLCDNHHPSFSELEETISKQLYKRRPISIPFWTAKLLGFIGDIVGDKFPINSNKLHNIIQPLTFSNEKAKRELGWEPLDVLDNFIIH